MYEYAHSLALHGDGEPLLICYEEAGTRLCYAVMKRDVCDFHVFHNELEPGQYYDLETPYGYGGPLCEGVISEASQKRFLRELTEYCQEENIAAQFLRFHPLLDNQNLLSDVIESRYLRDTVYMDTTSPEVIFSNMDSKNRNVVRKAARNGVEIHREPVGHYADFKSMYDETMRNHGADSYYTFSEEYFASLEKMADHASVFYAVVEGRKISGAIMFYNDRYMHYHLSGTHPQFKKLSPSNLLLFEAGIWACEKGIGKFHLGGGMAPDDSLFGFKKQFNKNGRLPFCIGRTIFNKEQYDRLRQLRKQLDPEFDPDNTFMIQYRG